MSDRFEFAHEPRLGLGYLYLNDGLVAKTVEVANGVSVDVAEDGTVIGVELLNLGREEPPITATTVPRLDPTRDRRCQTVRRRAEADEPMRTREMLVCGLTLIAFYAVGFYCMATGRV